VALALLVGMACIFAPDLSRFPECDAQRPCPEGSTCLADVGRCLPDCGEREDCVPPLPLEDGGTDAGGGPDGGDAGEPDGGLPLILVPAGLDAGTEEFAYTHQFLASGGTPPHGFTALDALPPGLSLTDGGTLSGTPAAAGNFLLRIQVVDQGTPPRQAQRDYPLHIRQRLRVAGPSFLADAPINAPYQEGIQATGGLPPYTFTLDTNSGLPAGLFLYGDGGVSGTAQESISRGFGVQVTDSDTPPQTASGNLSLSTVSCDAFCIRTRAVPEGRVGTPYSYTLQHSGGTSPIQWKVAQGTLPPGLSLSLAGVLSGTPTQARDVQLTFSATESPVLFPKTLEVVVTLRVR
jgi:hypothetical protein